MKLPKKNANPETASEDGIELTGLRWIQCLQQNIGPQKHGEDTFAREFCDWPDAYYERFHITNTEREILRLLADGLSMEKLLLGCLGLMLNPTKPPSFWGEETFFELFQKAFHCAHDWLRRLYTKPETGDPKRDVEISEWAGHILVKHYAETVIGWKQSRGRVGKAKDDDSIPAEGSEFLACAMAGQTINRKGEVKRFSPLPLDWFRERMEKVIDRHSTAFMLPFVMHCLNWAMFFPEPPKRSARRAVNDDFQRKCKQAIAKGVALPRPTEEERDAMKRRLSDEVPEFKRMTEDEFAFAWDRGGLGLDKLIALTKQLRQSGKGGIGSDGKVRGQLPIKAVMNEELQMLQRLCEENNSKREGKNGATYLSWKEGDLLKLLRPLFGLPRDKKVLRSKQTAKP